jgi:hypothetical protein
MTNDDDNKPVDLKEFRRRKGCATFSDAAEQFDETIWQETGALWARCANEATRVPESPHGLAMSGDPDAVFSRLLENLVMLAQAQGVENDDILEMLLSHAITECKPTGRLYELLHKASDLLEYGDENASEIGFRALHAAGKITDEELQRELRIPE